MARLLAWVLCASGAFAQDFTGTWTGVAKFDGGAREQGVCVSLWQGKGFSGAVTFDGDQSADITGGRATPSGIEVNAGPAILRLNGDESKLSGEVRIADQVRSVTLTKLIPKGNPFGPGFSALAMAQSRPEPEYTPEARAAKLQGAVDLQIEILPSGAVGRNVQVVRGLGMGLDEKAIEAVMKWRFNPPRMDCKASPKSAQVQVNFRLR